MNFSNTEIADAVRVTLTQLDVDDCLPVILMPRDPEAIDAPSRSDIAVSEKIRPVERLD